ncbi:hypothetical protein AcV5_009371 [Taiwanofungus camphoratus]|nr:hypothetical protein AcV5_009371 [Antrodia cinnamomea]
MSDKRRAEIEAKRVKLAELRKARADRQKAEAERRQSDSGGPSTVRRDVDDLVSSLVGPSRGVDSAIESPVSSVPGTPALGQTSSLPGPSALSLSGRLSRQSDAASDRISLGTTFVQSVNGTTDHVVDRYAVFFTKLLRRSLS